MHLNSSFIIVFLVVTLQLIFDESNMIQCDIHEARVIV